jgi:hypothetical protein
VGVVVRELWNFERTWRNLSSVQFPPLNTTDVLLRGSLTEARPMHSFCGGSRRGGVVVVVEEMVVVEVVERDFLEVRQDSGTRTPKSTEIRTRHMRRTWN